MVSSLARSQRMRARMLIGPLSTLNAKPQCMRGPHTDLGDTDPHHIRKLTQGCLAVALVWQVHLLQKRLVLHIALDILKHRVAFD